MNSIFAIATAISMLATTNFANTEQKPSICVIGRFDVWLTNRIDATYKQKLNALGYQIDSLDYSEVTAERLKPFNVLLLEWAPYPSETEALAIYRKAIPILHEYIKNGGGILVTCEEAYETHRTVNEFLKSLGAEILPENVLDDKTIYQQKRYLQWFYCSTTNIASHSITSGINEICYPLGFSPEDGAGTLALKLGDDWQTIIKGNPSSHSSKGTISTEPPILVVRQIEKGRIAIFPSHATFWTHAGYHRIWEGICMEKGNGFQLFSNIYNWLGEPSLQSSLYGGYVETSTPKPSAPISTEGVASTDIYTKYLNAGGKPFVSKITHKADNRRDFVGIIGIHSSYSNIKPNDYGGGVGSVTEYCERAKKLGYSYLVFTEDFRAMNPTKWDQLVADCKSQTTDDFIAIPGLEYKDTWDNSFIAFNLPRYPEKEWLSDDGQRIKNLPGIYFGLDWTPIYLMSPHLGFYPPWFAKFYSGLEVVSYNHGNRKIDDAFEWYRYVQGNDYNLIPITGHRITSPPELNGISGYLTHVCAEKVSDIPSGFKYQWYAPRHTYVSSGPILSEWTIENGRGGYREESWRIYINIQSEKGLKEIIVYDKDKIYRRFDPQGAKEFKTELDGYHDRQYFFTLEALDNDGGHLISSALYVSDIRQSIYMCTDLQNTLNCMQDIDPPSGKFTYFGVLGNHVTGWDSLHLGILAAEWEIMPQGLDYVIKGFGGGLSHFIYAENGQESAVARRDMVFACGDCNMLDNYYETKFYPGTFATPTELAVSRSRMISFTPRPYSYNMMIIEQEITFKKDLTFPEREGPEVAGLTIGGPSEVFDNYIWVDGSGNKQLGKRNDPVTVKEGVINPGGYVALYPDFYGSFGVYSLDKTYTFRLENAYITLGYDLAGKSVKAGDKITGRWLIVRGKFGATEQEDANGFEEIRKLYGLDGKPIYNVVMEQGKLESQNYTLVLKADNYSAKANISQAPLPNDLPMIVNGIEDNWDAGMLDLDTKELRRCGIFNGSAYLTLDINGKPRNIIIGNLLICNDNRIRLSLIKKDDVWLMQAHNPTEESISVAIKTSDWLKDIIPQIQADVIIQPGNTWQSKIDFNSEK